MSYEVVIKSYPEIERAMIAMLGIEKMLVILIKKIVERYSID